MKRSEVQSMEPRFGRLCLDGWAGRSSVPVVVTGETEKRYRVRFLEATTLPHLAAAAVGDVKFVPKYSVVLK